MTENCDHPRRYILFLSALIVPVCLLRLIHDSGPTMISLTLRIRPTLYVCYAL